MKVIQPFFLGGACGLALALIIAIGLYASPLRKGLYLDADPEIAALREKLELIRHRIASDEIGIAEARSADPAAARRSSDSLKNAQAGAWKEYRHWRNRMGDLARLHDRATPAGFPAWAYSLRYWLLPAAALMSLLPALMLAFRGARRRKGAIPAKAKPPARQPDRAEALSSFEAAVKQVARITATGKPADDPPEPVPPRGRENRPAPAPESSPYDAVSGSMFSEPETAEFPLPEADAPEAEARPAGTETQFLNFGPGWGESHPNTEGEAVQAPRPAARGLSMEDEDGRDIQEQEDPPSGSFMPPTTEVEKVERRKAEVLKLARKGLTSSEISRRLRISQDQVEFIIRMRREKG